MTNKDFYGDSLLAVALKGNCYKLYKMVHGKGCVGLKCKDCEFGETKESEIENVEKWLNAEYEEPEPPLLENGDELKSGDWIMVRNENRDEWSKRQFMCYFQSLNRPFVTLEEMSSWYLGKHECWLQARLPMEGE